MINVTELLKTVGITEWTMEAYLEQNPDLEKTEVGGYGVKGKYISYDDVGLAYDHVESQAQAQVEQYEQLLLRHALSSTLLHVATASETVTSS